MRFLSRRLGRSSSAYSARLAAASMIGCCLCTGTALVAHGERARADLVIRTLATGPDTLRRARREITLADSRRRRSDPRANGTHAFIARRDRAALARLQKVQHDARGPVAVHLLVRERVQ